MSVKFSVMTGAEQAVCAVIGAHTRATAWNRQRRGCDLQPSAVLSSATHAAYACMRPSTAGAGPAISVNQAHAAQNTVLSRCAQPEFPVAKRARGANGVRRVDYAVESGGARILLGDLRVIHLR